jgi:orotidine-5'-phosphate decarboxylase
MLRPSFAEQLRTCEQNHNSLVCVGLDPLPDSMPDGFDGTEGVYRFCHAIVDSVADLVCAFKPQIAHFAALGAERELAALIEYVHEHHPTVPVILDAKRGDVGATAERYAIELFDRYRADAATVNPYLGPESLRPYLKRTDRGVFILCRTSNPENAWLQDFPSNDPVYLRVARAAAEWNVNDNVMLVVGATYPEDLGRVRSVVGDMTVLVPGVGSQGGDVAAAINAGLNSRRSGLIVNASRSVLYASKGSDFADAARSVTRALRDEINQLRRVSL